MKINDIFESTTSGSVASVAMPMGSTQKREGKLFKGKITKKPFYEQEDDESKKKPKKDFGKMFQKKIDQSNKAKKDTEQKVKAHTVKEDEIIEQDLILMPGQLKGKDKSFIPNKLDRRDHEVEMARSDLFAAAKDAQRIYAMLKSRTEDEGLMGWQQSYITLACDYLNSVADSLEHQAHTNEMTGGVLAGGMSNFEEGVAEGLNEFAPPGSGDNGNDGFSDDTLKRLAAQWYNGDEDPRVERTLAAAGWEIGQDEGYDDEPGVFVVQAGDINGNSYISWPSHELKQGVAEGYSNTTFNVDRRKLNVPALIQKGAILVTHPHGEQGWETDNKEDWAFSLLSLYNVLQGGWPSEAKKYLKPQSYKRAEQQINSSAPNLGSDKLVYDGKYNQILWSIKKLGIPDNVAFLDKDKQGVAEDQVDEEKDACYSKVKSRYKVWPSAYASGALVKCRKVGAANWGNSSKK